MAFQKERRAVRPARQSAVGSLSAVFRDGLRGALALLYPSSCLGCGRLTVEPGALCPQCWQGVRFIEQPFCEVMGTPFSHDLGRDILSPRAIADPPIFDRLRAVASHEGVCRKMVHALKYQDRLDLAPVMARWMVRAASHHVETADVVVPVPLHPLRLFSRRFNQSAELARRIAEISGKPFDPIELKRIRRTAHQVGLGHSAREDNVRGAFAVSEKGALLFSGRKVILVDDVYTTGATVSAAAKALKKAGASEVTVLVFAMVLPEPI